MTPTFNLDVPEYLLPHAVNIKRKPLNPDGTPKLDESRSPVTGTELVKANVKCFVDQSGVTLEEVFQREGVKVQAVVYFRSKPDLQHGDLLEFGDRRLLVEYAKNPLNARVHTEAGCTERGPAAPV
jgi:hypothetical protein